MANGHGGQRTPANPAPVSGPGALSQRTDGSPASMVASSGAYGDRKDMTQIQQGASMSQPQPPQGHPSGVDPSTLTPLGAPTTRPDEPVTAGVGSIPDTASVPDDEDKAKVLAAFPTLAWAAAQPQASEQLRQFVRNVRASL